MIGFDEVINNYAGKLLLLVKEYKLPKATKGISFNKLFNNDIGSCIDYYMQVCKETNIVSNVSKFNKLIQHVKNAKIDELLGHESEEIKNILKICYESKT